MNYHNVIIGSSPVCLLEALYKSQKGEKTCVIDSAERLGGAWKTLEMDESGIGHVEIGCHIFEKDKKVFRFLEDKLKLQLILLDPQPKITYGKKWMRYNLKNFFFVFRDVKLYFKYKYGFSHFRMNLYLFFKELAQLRLKYYSFKHSSNDLAIRLVELVKNSSIETKLNSIIKSVRVNTMDKSIELITNSNEKILTKNLTLAYTTHIDEFWIDGENKSSLFQKQKSEFVHLHLLVKDENLKKFSYLRVFKSNMIHRISDMSNQVDLNLNEHIICIGIYTSAFGSKTKEEIFEEVGQLLQKMEILSTTGKILKTRWNSYASNTTDFNDLKKLEKLTNNLVQVIYTPDMTLGLRKNLYKFNSIKFT